MGLYRQVAPLGHHTSLSLLASWLLFDKACNSWLSELSDRLKDFVQTVVSLQNM